jgi:hypothetical protein
MRDDTRPPDPWRGSHVVGLADSDLAVRRLHHGRSQVC